jgi:hypothetical protein
MQSPDFKPQYHWGKKKKRTKPKKPISTKHPNSKGWTHPVFKSFCFLAALGFELRASHLLGRHSYHLHYSTSPFVIFFFLFIIF